MIFGIQLSLLFMHSMFCVYFIMQLDKLYNMLKIITEYAAKYKNRYIQIRYGVSVTEYQNNAYIFVTEYAAKILGWIQNACYGELSVSGATRTWW